MAELLRRRAAISAGSAGPLIPDISLPNVNITRLQTTSPNHVYIKNNSINTPLYNLREPSRSVGSTNDNYPSISGDSVWFTIPADASCELKIVNLAKATADGRGTVLIGIRKAGDNNTSRSQPYTSSIGVTAATSISKSFVTAEDMAVHCIYARTGGTAKYISFDVELYVNGDRWL